MYSREILRGLAAAHTEVHFRYCFRPHRFLRALKGVVPSNVSRGLLLDAITPRASLFHGLNQRLPGALRAPAVTTFHDLFVLTGDYSTPEFRRRFAEQARDAAARSNLIITVSEFTARQVHELLGVDRSRIRVIHHGVRSPALIPVRAREDLVLTVGALQARKNIERLIEAFEQSVPGYRLMLAGSFGYGADQILERIARSPRRAEIDVRGYVPADELTDLYARARIFAFPSLDEGFGIPMLEAMASGVPVITSNVSALPEIAGDAGLLVDPYDTAALATALERLAHDTQLRDELVGRGFARAKEFTWRRAVAYTWAVYAELL